MIFQAEVDEVKLLVTHVQDLDGFKNLINTMQDKSQSGQKIPKWEAKKQIIFDAMNEKIKEGKLKIERK